VQREVPVGVMVVRKVGWRQGLRALTYVVAWGIAADREGRALTVEEYADYWKESRATAYREFQAFRRVWPKEENPARIWGMARERVGERKRADVAAAQLGALVL
jgi:hypothetical protein